MIIICLKKVCIQQYKFMNNISDKLIYLKEKMYI